jgi:predicted ATP-binding protein involved in virulence
MEKKINKKIDSYLFEFKEGIKNKAYDLGLFNSENEQKLLQYIYDYEKLVLEKDDFIKRKRNKNTISYFDRCCAKKANGEQCSRRKKSGVEYCGSHSKCTPHGVIDSIENENKNVKHKIDVWVQDIKGILYHLDKNGNVYCAEDIVLNKSNPSVIAKYTKTGDSFSIPEFGI